MASIIDMLMKLEGKGEGVLKGFYGDSVVVVRFGDEDVILNFPQAFSEGLSATNPEDEARIGELIEWWNSGRSSSPEDRQRRAEAVINGTAAPMLETTEAVMLHQRNREAVAEALKEKERKDREKRDRLAEQQKERESIHSTANNVHEKSSVGWTIGIIFAILSLVGFVLAPIGGFKEIIPLLIAGIIAWVLLGFIAHVIFLYKGRRNIAGKIFFVITFISYYILLVFAMIFVYVINFIIKLFKDDFGGFSVTPKKSEMTWTVPEGGYNRILKETGEIKSIDGRRYKRYRDNIGQYWLSADEENFIKEGK